MKGCRLSSATRGRTDVPNTKALPQKSLVEVPVVLRKLDSGRTRTFLKQRCGAKDFGVLFSRHRFNMFVKQKNVMAFFSS
jgi:hypothetical protein